MAAERVVSLIASATEIVCALDCGERLVGRSHECDFPDFVRDLPVCTEPKFDTEGTSYEIDQRVKAILAEALSVYRVDTDLLASLAPDVVVTQTQCEVCAVSLRDVEACLTKLTRRGGGIAPELVALAPNALGDVWTDVRRLAAALEVPERGKELILQAKDRISAITTAAAALRPMPRIACIEWIEPLMAAGNWMPELVEMAGGDNVFGKAGAHSPWLNWDAFRTADPDVIVVLPCGYSIGESRRNMASLTGSAGWSRLDAVETGRVFIADGSQYFNRPGLRLVESLEILAEILHPEAFHFGHEGRGWVRWANGATA